MAGNRDDRGRFARKSPDELSPAYRRRIERAEARGKLRAEARGHGTQPRRAWETADVSTNPRYDKSLEVLGRVRRGQTLSRASRAIGIAPDTVLRYVGSAFRRGPRGRWVAKPTDRLVRRMRFLDARGWLPVEPANSREASKLAEYWNAVGQFVSGEDDGSLLRRFDRMRLRTRQKTSLRFLTDLDALERLGHAGELTFEDVYEH
jgi:hypothetical protein